MVKGGQVVMAGDLFCKHTIQHKDDVLQNCTPETYLILLTNIIPINSIKKFSTKYQLKGSYTMIKLDLFTNASWVQYPEIN